MFWRKLSAAEEEAFRQWARDNWEPGKTASEAWHPVTRQEWARLDNEFLTTAERKEEE